jgi:CMP-N,N'-diacetyllegionaminic acid synthase
VVRVRVVGVIPARGGSKRLPNKNLALLAGEPMIAYTCRAALASGVLDAVVCNTDSPSIAAAARRFGVDVPALRPAELADDDSPMQLAVAWVLQLLAEKGRVFDVVVLLQPTSPLRSEQDVRRALKLYQQHAPCAVLSVTDAHPPIDWYRQCDRAGRLEPVISNGSIRGRVCRLNGAIYAHPAAYYLHGEQPDRQIAYWMPRERSVDVDHADDLALAEFYLLAGQPAT